MNKSIFPILAAVSLISAYSCDSSRKDDDKLPANEKMVNTIEKAAVNTMNEFSPSEIEFAVKSAAVVYNVMDAIDKKFETDDDMTWDERDSVYARSDRFYKNFDDWQDAITEKMQKSDTTVLTGIDYDVARYAYAASVVRYMLIDLSLFTGEIDVTEDAITVKDCDCLKINIKDGVSNIQAVVNRPDGGQKINLIDYDYDGSGWDAKDERFYMLKRYKTDLLIPANVSAVVYSDGKKVVEMEASDKIDLADKKDFVASPDDKAEGSFKISLCGFTLSVKAARTEGLSAEWNFSKGNQPILAIKAGIEKLKVTETEVTVKDEDLNADGRITEDDYYTRTDTDYAVSGKASLSVGVHGEIEVLSVVADAKAAQAASEKVDFDNQEEFCNTVNEYLSNKVICNGKEKASIILITTAKDNEVGIVPAMQFSDGSLYALTELIPAEKADSLMEAANEKQEAFLNMIYEYLPFLRETFESIMR